MPSLRRTFSDSYSNPRSSPYPSALSLSASGALNANNGSGSMRMRRAASGSETSTRRVLADIEWWRVTPGQQSEPEENASEEDAALDLPAVGSSDVHEGLATTTIADEGHSTLDAAFVLEDGMFSSTDVSQGVGSFSYPSFQLNTPMLTLSSLTPVRSFVVL